MINTNLSLFCWGRVSIFCVLNFAFLVVVRYSVFRSFRGLAFMFRSLIDGELIFTSVTWELNWDSLFSRRFSACSNPFHSFQLYFPHSVILKTVKKSIGHKCVGLFLGYLFCFIGLSTLMPMPYCFDYCTFIVSLEIREYESSKFVLLYKSLCLFWVLCFSI